MFKKIIIILSILILLVTPCSANMLKNHIFVISSYHVGDPCGQPQFNAVIESLQHAQISNLSFTGHFLDTRRLHPDIVKQKVEFIKEDIRTLQPKAVVVLDDPAFAMFYEFIILEHPNIYLVFSGINRDLKEYDLKQSFLDETGRPNKNITGVFEYMFMEEQLSLLEEILDNDIDKVAFLHSTDPVGNIISKQLVNELKGTKYENTLVLYPISTVDQLIETCYIIQNDDTIDAWIPGTLSVKDNNDNILLMYELSDRMIDIIKKPDLALNSSFTEFGFFGGVSVDFYQMGYQAGLQVIKLLQGVPIENLPIENTTNSYVAINLSRAKELQLKLTSEILSKIDIIID